MTFVIGCQSIVIIGTKTTSPSLTEASLLKRLKHANIVTLHDIIHTKESLTFVFEFIQCDLGHYLERLNGEGIHPFNCKLFLFQLFRGLDFCHRHKILHRDLKPPVITLQRP